MEARHHRAHRNLECLGDFAIAHLFDIAEYDDVPEGPWHGLQGPEDVLIRQVRWDGWYESDRVGQAIVKILRHISAGSRTPAVAADVLKNRHQPRATVRAWRESSERSKGLEEGLLHEVLGLLAVAFHPHREAEKPVDMWHRLRLEGGPFR
jgi:hypothetical protein